MFNFLKQDSDYVTRVNYYKPHYTSGKPEANFGPEDKEILEILKSIESKVKKTEYLKKVNETMFMDILGFNDLKFTITTDGSNTDIKVGWDKEVHPTISVSLTKQNLVNFVKILDDGDINEEELQRILHIMLIPSLKAFYHSEMINTLQDVSMLKLDKLAHIQITNSKNYTIQDTLIDSKATVMSILGQFIILPGHIGVAPVVVTVSPEEALEYYDLLRYQFPSAKNIIDKKKLFDKYMNLRERTVKSNPKYTK
jgi:hypothetical protein